MMDHSRSRGMPIDVIAASAPPLNSTLFSSSSLGAQLANSTNTPPETGLRLGLTGPPTADC